jgi:hypothetical protein
MRYAVSTGAAERDVTQDPKGALKVAIKGHQAAITEHGKYVFPSLHAGQIPMSENTINAALQGKALYAVGKVTEAGC